MPLELNEYQKSIQLLIDSERPIIRMYGERYSGKTTFLIDRAIKLASHGHSVLFVDHSPTAVKLARTTLLDQLLELDIRNHVSWHFKNLIEFDDSFGKIQFVSANDYTQAIRCKRFDEILIDNDHLIDDQTWELISNEILTVCNRVISLSS